MKQHDTNSVLPSMEGDIALVTGGNSGIGRATALQFANLGAKVIISARRIREAEETIDLIRRNNGECIFIKTDVTIPGDVQTMMETIISKYSRLDYAFNNAGVLGYSVPNGRPCKGRGDSFCDGGFLTWDSSRTGVKY